ncbi:MAG: sulfatase-like hydrolase/transferase [Thermoguttaceae bacterium]
MRNTQRFALFLVLVPALAGSAFGGAAGSRPNIVLMLIDDMGWADPGFHGGNAELTPHMDRLAEQSVQFTQFYTHAVCAPARAALLTGRYPFRMWMDWRSEDFGKPSYLKALGMELAHNQRGEPTRMIHAMDAGERTVAEALREAGYFTALIGKWHLGEWLPEHLPMGQGFQHQYGHYGWGIDYNNYTIPHNAPARFAVYDWHRNQQPLNEQGYATDLFANETVRLLSEQTADRPFFFFVSFNAIHGPLEDIPRYTDQYDKRDAALKCLDDAVGRIVGAVEQHGFAGNTLIILTNDNGGLRPEFNRPYRGTKNTNYEGGVRVPCLMRFDGKLEPGAVNDGMMHVIDLLPTFCTLAKAPAQQARPLDGLDMTAVIFAGAPSPRREIVFEVSGSVRPPAIRSGNYKLVGDELYNLAEDESETTDIASQHPQVVQRLKARLEEVGKERPPLSDLIGREPLLMDPPLPYVYGRDENRDAPEWVKERVRAVRATQPTEWAPGETPWPQAPKDGKIIYTGDGR